MLRAATVHLSIKHTRGRQAGQRPALMSLGGRGKFGPFPILSMNFFKSVLRYSNTCNCAASGLCRQCVGESVYYRGLNERQGKSRSNDSQALTRYKTGFLFSSTCCTQSNLHSRKNCNLH